MTQAAAAATGAQAAPTNSFANVLKQGLDQVSQTQARASDLAMPHVWEMFSRLTEPEVRGNPDVSISVKGFQSAVGSEGPEYGIVGTAAHCVNSVPAVCAAEPGIATYLDLPLISGKAAPHLS